MKIAVVGLGAVGGLMAARLALAGHAVSALARGATLAAVQANGLCLRQGGNEHHAAVQASDDASTLGPQALVIVALKGPALASAAGSIAALCSASTVVMPAMNGVPWWFLRTGAPAARFSPAQQALDSVDPGGRIDAAVALDKLLACVVHLASSSPEPGVVQHGFGQRLIVGEPNGGLSERVTRVCEALASAGFDAQASADIRTDIWFKLWGNITMNPVSALTGATADQLLDDPLVRAFMSAVMAEAAAVGAQVGCNIQQSGEERMAITRQLGAFKTSMLQDLQAGRALEIDALVGAVHQIGRRVGVATPNIDALLGLVRLMARQRGLYPAAPA